MSSKNDSAAFFKLTKLLHGLDCCKGRVDGGIKLLRIKAIGVVRVWIREPASHCFVSYKHLSCRLFNLSNSVSSFPSRFLPFKPPSKPLFSPQAFLPLHHRGLEASFAKESADADLDFDLAK